MSERQYIPEKQDYSRFNELCTVVYQDQTYELCMVVYQDQTLTEISRFDIPFTHISILGFCNGMFFFHKYRTQILYLWNPSIRKYKMLSPHFTGRYNDVVQGLAYHSQNNDFKILKIAFQRSVTGIFALLMVYTMSTDSWRRVVVSLDSEPNIGLIHHIDTQPLFLNGALHFMVYSNEHGFILTFDVDDKRFRKIMLLKLSLVE